MFKRYLFISFCVLYTIAHAKPQKYQIDQKDTINLPSFVKQLIIVTPQTATTGQVVAYTKNKSSWSRVSFTPFNVVVGRNGIVTATDKVEGDKKTPAGLYSLGTAFGNLPMSIHYPYIKTNEADKFIDDPKNSEYNHWVHGDTAAASYEEMLRSDGVYNLGIVINYNINPTIAGRGSAIFMHIWYGSHIPTTGCVAMDKTNLFKLIKWLDKKNNPYILIKYKHIS